MVEQIFVYLTRRNGLMIDLRDFILEIKQFDDTDFYNRIQSLICFAKHLNLMVDVRKLKQLQLDFTRVEHFDTDLTLNGLIKLNIY